MSSPFQKNFSKKSPFAQSIEHQAEEYLGFPQEKARQRTDKYLNIVPDKDGLMQEQNSFEHGDLSRHYFAGDETARSIQKKLGGFGNTFVGKMIASAGSNVGGIIHEAQNILDGRPIMESIEDVANNFAGSIGSFLPRESSEELLDTYKKYGPDGKVKK